MFDVQQIYPDKAAERELNVSLAAESRDWPGQNCEVCNNYN